VDYTKTPDVPSLADLPPFSSGVSLFFSECPPYTLAQHFLSPLTLFPSLKRLECPSFGDRIPFQPSLLKDRWSHVPHSRQAISVPPAFCPLNRLGIVPFNPPPPCFSPPFLLAHDRIADRPHNASATAYPPLHPPICLVLLPLPRDKRQVSPLLLFSSFNVPVLFRLLRLL